jgi:hypothetical protein
MGIEANPRRSGPPQERRAADGPETADPAEQSKTMTAPRRRSRLPGQPRQLDAGPLEPLIGSFALHLAAEGRAARTVQGYTSVVRWFAASSLAGEPGKTSWEQVDAPDIQRWMTKLLDRYSGAYASIQFRALRQFFKWRAEEDELPDPMARLRAPKVTVAAVPVFTSVELSDLDKACQGRSFAARRDAAIIAYSPRPASASPSWPGSATTPATPPAATSTCTPERSRSAAKAAQPGPSRSATRQPAASTATCGPAPGTRRRTGPSCGWA